MIINCKYLGSNSTDKPSFHISPALITTIEMQNQQKRNIKAQKKGPTDPSHLNQNANKTCVKKKGNSKLLASVHTDRALACPCAFAY